MIWNCDHKMGQSRQKHNYYIFYGKVKIPTYFYKRYYWKQNIVQPRGYDYLPFFLKRNTIFLNKRRRESKNSDNQVKDPSKSQTFHSKYSGKGKKYADLKGNISIKCLNKLF